MGSVVLTTQAAAKTGSRLYRAYGAKRSGDEFPFERNYTGQHLDDTGLLYYGARYYDPAAGRFISPDTLVPDPGNVLDYNRYLYGRGNPISNHDPSGYCVASAFAPSPAASVLDAACWTLVEGTGMATAVAAAPVVGAVVLMGGVIAGIPLTTDELPAYPPPYPAQEPGQIIESFPLPGATTLTIEGTPLLQQESPGIQGITPEHTPGLLVLQASAKLDRNMQAAGMIRPADSAAHHIVAQNDQRAALARAILAGAGIAIDDAINGVYLPQNMTSPNSTGAAVHSGIHTRAYYNEVEQRLLNPGPGGVPGVLQQIGQELMNNTFPYR